MNFFRKMVLIFMASIFLSSCGSPTFNEILNDNIPNQNIDISFNNLDEAWLWVDYNIRYVKDIGDYKQLPEETYRLRTGDCEDFSLLLAYFIEQFDPGSVLMVCVNKVGSIYNHMIIKYKGKYLEPQSYNKYYEVSSFNKIIFEVPYEQYFFNSGLGF